MNTRSCGRRAYSPVIAALILSAAVLTVGGACWAYSQGAMTITSEEYAESVIEMIDQISERFIIEHAYYNGSHLFIWVFNYGEVDMDVKISVKNVNYPSDQDLWIQINSCEMISFSPIDVSASPGETLNIRAYTKRGNNAFYRYLVPQV